MGPDSVVRPFIDFEENTVSAHEMEFYSDVTKGHNLGFGGYFKSHWVYHRWSDNFIKDYDPSIEFLELYAVTVNIYLWGHLLPNRRVIIFCDNESVVCNINKASAKGRKSMTLIRLITLICLKHNTC